MPFELLRAKVKTVSGANTLNITDLGTIFQKAPVATLETLFDAELAWVFPSQEYENAFGSTTGPTPDILDTLTVNVSTREMPGPVLDGTGPGTIPIRVAWHELFSDQFVDPDTFELRFIDYYPAFLTLKWVGVFQNCWTKWDIDFEQEDVPSPNPEQGGLIKPYENLPYTITGFPYFLNRLMTKNAIWTEDEALYRDPLNLGKEIYAPKFFGQKPRPYSVDVQGVAERGNSGSVTSPSSSTADVGLKVYAYGPLLERIDGTERDHVHDTAPAVTDFPDYGASTQPPQFFDCRRYLKVNWKGRGFLYDEDASMLGTNHWHNLAYPRYVKQLGQPIPSDTSYQARSSTEDATVPTKTDVGGGTCLVGPCTFTITGRVYGNAELTGPVLATKQAKLIIKGSGI